MRAGAAIWGALLGLLAAVPAGAQVAELQRQIAESRVRLDEIRSERERLQSELEGARGGVVDASRELQNIERQLSASRSVLAELNLQLEIANTETEENSKRLEGTRARHAEATKVLHRRLRDVYKLGPLHTVRVLLGADSFVDLLNRYRYLQMIAAYDRALIQRVGVLEADLSARGRELQTNMAELGRLRQAQVSEVAELRSVEEERQFALTNYRSQEAQTLSRLETLDRDDQRMRSLMGDLERRRLAEAPRPAGAPARGASAVPTGSTTTTARAGMEWPVTGNLVYRFGLDQRPNGTTLRWNGIGIGAALGTPVQAVLGGTVVLAGPFEGYGPSVILSHGDGLYTLYLYLDDIGVVEGRPVTTGQVVGTVGGQGTPEGAHIEFQIRAPLAANGTPQAQDPMPWLRTRPDGVPADRDE
jgi:septal ring factor EnvC (AmiA/AmiB activator)